MLKSFLKTDYRGLAAHLADCASLLEVLQLDAVPRYTTLQSVLPVIGCSTGPPPLDATVREHMGRKRRVRRAPSTRRGWNQALRVATSFDVRERLGIPAKRSFISLAKLGVVCDVEAHIILAVMIRRRT